MSYEKKIEKELAVYYARQWEDAVCPSVKKFGRQADKRIAKLQAENERLKRMLAIAERYGLDDEEVNDE